MKKAVVNPSVLTCLLNFLKSVQPDRSNEYTHAGQGGQGAL